MTRKTKGNSDVGIDGTSGDDRAGNEQLREVGEFDTGELGAPDENQENVSKNPQYAGSTGGPLGEEGSGDRQNDQLAELSQQGGLEEDLKSRSDEPARPFHNHPENAPVTTESERGETPEEAKPFGPRPDGLSAAQETIRAQATAPGSNIPVLVEERKN